MVQELVLNRFIKSPRGTLGCLSLDGTPLAFTLELPWRDNFKEISCIPTGYYNCVKLMHPTKGMVAKFVNVPNRSGILIHPGNSLDDTQGCILPGRYMIEATPHDSLSLRDSRFVHALLMSKLGDYFNVLIQ